jgi:hypothetical protein
MPAPSAAEPPAVVPAELAPPTPPPIVISAEAERLLEDIEVGRQRRPTLLAHEAIGIVSHHHLAFLCGCLSLPFQSLYNTPSNTLSFLCGSQTIWLTILATWMT